MGKIYYVGIDPGLHGGIVVINEEQQIVYKSIMPVMKSEYDLVSIGLLFEHWKSKARLLVCLEKSQPHYRDGSKQAFKTGEGFGALQGILHALHISFELIQPKMWQKKIFQGLPMDDTKLTSILFAKRKYPEESWKASDRCTKSHDGMTDALGLALYCLEKNRRIKENVISTQVKA